VTFTSPEGQENARRTGHEFTHFKPMTDPLIDSLRKAVDVSPDDTRLRLHLAEMLRSRGGTPCSPHSLGWGSGRSR
jgi:hypothetical protein